MHLVQILYTYVFQYCPATDVENDNEASPSIILADRAHVVKIFITLGPHGIFGSNFAFLCILHCPATGMQNCDEASPSFFFGWSSSFGENAHDS